MEYIINFNYEYAKNTDYDTDEEFYSLKYENRPDKNVDAIYTKAVSEFDRGNAFIEALPRIRSKERFELDSINVINSFNHDKLKRKDLEEQITLLMDLYKVRTLIPNQYVLEGMFSNLLIQVYRSRNYKIVKSNMDFKQRVKKDISSLYAYGKVDEAPPAGFSLLGYAGCGKTSMIGSVLKHYPQVIWHRNGEEYFPQITYIMTNANSSSKNDFHAILNDIVRQIDIAVGFDEGCYYKKCIRLSNYDKKIGFIKQLITMYNIGCIIIDEIQAIDFRKNDKETYSKILQITNETNVGFIMVGTEEAYDRMFSNLHMHRRFPPIIASSYTGNIKFVNFFLRSLFKYQWFDDEVKIPDFGQVDNTWDDLVRSFYECTNGIAALMVGLYEKMNFEYLIRRAKPVVDGDFVRKVFKKYFGTLGKTLDTLDKGFSYNRLKKALSVSDLRKDEILSQLEFQKDFNEKTNGKFDQSQFKAQLVQSISKSISMCLSDSFNEVQIENACKKVVGKKDSLSKPEQVLTQEVIKLLNSKPKKSTRLQSLPPGLQEILS
ncbi:ATP-binding protein [Finegoldia magna]|uniref:ATP-binding protein n=1 Tax=Finegoldia magna TaxID=1260 RepID=UPI000B9176C3|nr:ATP-binding protein [Finegoldia magna]OXZ40156.1 hypothetical protein B9N50_00965 [Finegoldia magna]